MRVAIPSFKNNDERFAYLRTNIKTIIAQKKSMPIKSDIFEWGCLPVNEKSKIKEDGNILGQDEIEVNVIANLSGWCDCYMDVMIKDNWNKTIADKAITYHLKNHDYETDSIVGKNPELYNKNFDLSYFGIKSDVTKAQALMQRSIVPKEYDKKTYVLYKDGQIKQHSIGLRYVQIVLCLDSKLDEDKDYKKNWDKYYPIVINKDKVDLYGYFFAVIESQILEVSAVLFGANPNTGTYSTSEAKAADEALNEEKAADEAPTEIKRRIIHN